MQLSLYSVVIGILIAVIIVLIAATRRNIDRPGAKEVFTALILVLFALFFFELSLVIESDIRYLFHELKFLTLAYLAPCTLFVYLSFTGNGESLSLAQKLELCIIPFITVIFMLTNKFHHFFRLEFYTVIHDNVSYVDTVSSGWYYIYTAYSYVLYLAGILLLAVNYYRRPRLYRNQIGLMIFTSAAAVAIGAASALGLIHDYGDVGLVSGAIVCITQYITLVKFSHKIVVTKARNLVVGDISSVVLIFDHKDSLIDTNNSDEAFYAALKLRAPGDNKDDELFIPEIGKHYSVSEKRLFDEKGAAIGRVVVLNDITELTTTVTELEHITTHDYLTGLKNRQTFQRELRELDIAKLPAAFVYVNISGMNVINNIFGYEYGDRTIVRLSNEIRRLSGNGANTYGRLNGHEFGIILANSGESEAESFIRELTDSLSDSSVIALETGFKIINDKSRSAGQLINDITDAFHMDDELYLQSLPGKFYDFVRNSLEQLRDKTGARHKRITELCVRIAEDLQLTDEEKERLMLLSEMADIGLLSVSPSIVENIGSLTNDEWEEVKLHTVKGHNIALSINDISGIAREILTHHERYDGYGYPLGLKGDAIPLVARIFSIAEFFADAPAEQAVKLLNARRGTQFDPMVVDIVLKYI